MTIGVAESIVRRGALDAEDLLATLAREHEPARGYGKGMRMIFDAVAGGTSARRAAFVPWKEGSRGNGAAARVAPVACLHHEDPAALEAVAEESAGITHAHPIGRAGCVLQAIALGQALTLHAPGKLDGEAFLSSLSTRIAPRSPALASKLLQAATLLAGPWSPRTVAAALGNGVVADESVPLAIFAFAAWFPSFDEVVLRARGRRARRGRHTGALDREPRERAARPRSRDCLGGRDPPTPGDPPPRQAEIPRVSTRGRERPSSPALAPLPYLTRSPPPPPAHTASPRRLPRQLERPLGRVRRRRERRRIRRVGAVLQDVPVVALVGLPLPRRHPRRR